MKEGSMLLLSYVSLFYLAAAESCFIAIKKLKVQLIRTLNKSNPLSNPNIQVTKTPEERREEILILNRSIKPIN